MVQEDLQQRTGRIHCGDPAAAADRRLQLRQDTRKRQKFSWAEVSFFLRPAKKDIAGAGLQVASAAQSDVKKKADVFARRPFGV